MSDMDLEADSAQMAPSPIRLALVYPEDGPAKHDGTQSKQGALLAVDEINRRGGIRGRPVEAVSVNADIYTIDGVKRTFNDLREHDVDGVLMSYVFHEEIAFDEAASLGVPVLHTMTSKRHLSSVRSDPERFQALFQCVPPESNYGPGLVRFLDLFERKYPASERSVQFLETVVDSGQIADPETFALLETHGWRTVGVEALRSEPGSIDAIAEAIITNPPTVLVISEFLPSVLASLLLKLDAAGCSSVIYTIYAPSVPEFMDEMGSAAEGLVWATVSGTYDDPYGKEFRTAYSTAYGSSPGHSQAGLAYDMAHVMAAAWQQSTDPSDVTSSIEALRHTRYRGVNGSYTFAAGLQSTLAYPEETNDPSMGNAQLIFQVQNGQHRCLGPVPYDDGEFQWPGGRELAV